MSLRDGAGRMKIMTYHRHPAVTSRLLVIGLTAPLLLGLSACTEVNRLLARAESKPAENAERGRQVAEQAAPEPIPEPQEKRNSGKLYEWEGNGRRVSRIVVNTDEQKARFYDGQEQIGWTTVASGISKFPTPTGHFEVIEKVENKRSNLYGRIYTTGGKVVRSDAKAGRDPIPAGARFEGAKMPYFLRLTNDGVGLHAGPIPRPGRPASHGCIRMPGKLAPVLFEHVDLGTKVSIVGSGPNYGNYVQKQRAQAAALAARERERREAAAREQAVAAATSGGTPDPGSPAAGTISGAAAQAGAAAQSADRTETAGTTSIPTPVGGTAAVQTPAAGPSTAEATSDPASAAEPARPAPQSTPQTPAPQAADPVAQSVPPQPTSPSPPMVGAPATVPAPAYPAPLSPVAPPPYYAPPMRPAAATVPAPTPAQVPASASAPVPVQAPSPFPIRLRPRQQRPPQLPPLPRLPFQRSRPRHRPRRTTADGVLAPGLAAPNPEFGAGNRTQGSSREN